MEPEHRRVTICPNISRCQAIRSLGDGKAQSAASIAALRSFIQIRSGNDRSER